MRARGASGDADPVARLQLWAIATAHKGAVTALQISHNGRFLLSGGEGGGVRV